MGAGHSRSWRYVVASQRPSHPWPAATLLIGAAVEAVLDQSFTDFELIIVDDASGPATKAILSRYRDGRVRIITNTTQQGISKTRSAGLRVAQGECLFSTDSDCVVHRDWVGCGLKALTVPGTVAVEGLTFHVRPGYAPALSDKPRGKAEQRGQFMGCNIGYRAFLFIDPAMLDPRIACFEDRHYASPRTAVSHH